MEVKVKENGENKMTDEKSRGIGFNIPKIKRQISKDNVRSVNVNSRDAQDVIDSIKRSYLDQSYKGSWKVKNIQMVVNKDLDQQYRSKRLSLKEEGRHARDLTEQFAFLVIKDGYIIPKIAQNGLVTKASSFNALGDSKYGLHLCKHADLQLRFADTWGVESCSVFIFKVTLGKCKVIIGDGNCEGKEPVPNFDCHVSHQPAKPSDSLYTQLTRSQIYLYEYNEDYETVERPRHCLPHAIVEYEKVEETPTTTGYGSKPLQRQSSHGYERSRSRGSENTGYGPRVSKTQPNTNKTQVSKVPDTAQRNKNQTATQQAPARRQSWDSYQTSTSSDSLNNTRSEIPGYNTEHTTAMPPEYSSYSVKRSGADPRLKRRSASSTAEIPSSVSLDPDYSQNTNTAENNQTSVYLNYPVNQEPSVPTIKLGNMNLTLQTFAHTLAADLNPMANSKEEIRDKLSAVKSNTVTNYASNLSPTVRTDQTQNSVNVYDKMKLHVGFPDSDVYENKAIVGLSDSNVYDHKEKEEEESSDNSIQEVEMEDVSGIDLQTTESKETMFTIQVGENGSISSISAVPSQDNIDSNTKPTKAESYENLSLDSKNSDNKNISINDENNSKDFSKKETVNITAEQFLSSIPLPDYSPQKTNKSSKMSSVNLESGKKDSGVKMSEVKNKVNEKTDIETKYNTTEESYNQSQNTVSTQQTINEMDMYDPMVPTFSPEPAMEEDPYERIDTPSPQDSLDRSKSPDISKKDNFESTGKVYTYENKNVFDATEALQDVDLRLERTYSPLDVDMRVEQNSCSSTDFQSESTNNIHTSQSLYSLHSNQSNSSLNVQVPQNNLSSTNQSVLSSDSQTQHEITSQYPEHSSVMDVDMRKLTRNTGTQDVDLRYSNMDTDLRAAPQGIYSEYRTSSSSYSSDQQNYQENRRPSYSQDNQFSNSQNSHNNQFSNSQNSRDNQFYNTQNTGNFASYQRSNSQGDMPFDSYVTSKPTGVIEEYKTSGSTYRQGTNQEEHYQQNNYPVKQDYHQYPQGRNLNQESRYASNQYQSEGYNYNQRDYNHQNQSEMTSTSNHGNQQETSYRQWREMQRSHQDHGHNTQSGNLENIEQTKMENVEQQVKIESYHGDNNYTSNSDNALPKDKKSKTPLSLADYKARRKSGTENSPSTSAGENMPVMPNIQNILESVKNVDLGNLKNILQIVNITKQSSDAGNTGNKNNASENKLSDKPQPADNVVDSGSNNNNNEQASFQTNIPLVYRNSDYSYQTNHSDNQYTTDQPYSGRSTPVKDELPFYGGEIDHGSKSTDTVSDVQNHGKNNVEASSKDDHQLRDQVSESHLQKDIQQNIKQEPSEMNVSNVQTQKPAPSDDLSFLSIIKSEKGHGIIYTTNLIEEHGIPGFTSSSVYKFHEVKKEIVDSEMDSTTHQSTESAEGVVGSLNSKIGADNSDLQGFMATVKSEKNFEESLNPDNSKNNMREHQNKGAGEHQTKNKDKDKSAKDTQSETDINVSDKQGTLSIKITNSYSLAHVKTPEKQKTTPSPKKSPLQIKHEDSKPVVLTLRRNSLSDDENQGDVTNSKMDSSTSSGDSRRVVATESPLMKSTPAKDTFVKPNNPKHSANTPTLFDDSGSSLGFISCDGSYISEKEYLSNSRSSSHSNSSPARMKDVRRVVLSSDESRNPVKVERDVEIINTPIKQEKIDNVSVKLEDSDMRDTSHSSSQSSASSSGQKSKTKTKKVNKDMMGYRTRKRRRKRNKNASKDIDTLSNGSVEILSTTSSDILDNHDDDFDTISNRSSDRRTYTPPVCEDIGSVRTLGDFGLSHWSEALKSGVFQPKIVLTDITTKDSKPSDSCKAIISSEENIQNSPSKIIQELSVPNADEDYPQQKQDMVKQWLQIARKKIKLTLKPKQQPIKQATDKCETKTETKESETQEQVTGKVETQQVPATSSVKLTENQGMIPVLHRRIAKPRTTKAGPLCSKTKVKSETISQTITDSNKNVESPQTKTILSVPSVSRSFSSQKPLGSNSEPILMTEQVQTAQLSNIEPMNTSTPTRNLTTMSGQPINRQISQDNTKQIHSLQSHTSLNQESAQKVLLQTPTQPIWSSSNQHIVQGTQAQNQPAQPIQNQQVPGPNSSVLQGGQPIQIQSISNQQPPVLNIPAVPVPTVVSSVFPTMSNRPPPLNTGPNLQVNTRPPPLNTCPNMQVNTRPTGPNMQVTTRPTGPNMEVNQPFSGAPLQIRSPNVTGPPVRFPQPPITIPPPRQIPLINVGNAQMRQNLVVPSINQQLPHQIRTMSASVHAPVSQSAQILPIRQGMPPPQLQVPNSPHTLIHNRPPPPIVRPGNPNQPSIISTDFLRGPPPQAHQHQFSVANNRNVSQLTSRPPPVFNTQPVNPRPVHQIPTTSPTQPRQLFSSPIPQTRPPLLSQPRPPFNHPPPPGVPQYVPPRQISHSIQTTHPPPVRPSAPPSFPGNQIPSLINKQAQTPQRQVSIVQQFTTMPSAQNSPSPNQGVQRSNLVNIPSSTIPVVTGIQTVTSPQVRGQTGSILSSQTGTKRSKDPLDWFSDMIAPKKRPALDQNNSSQQWTNQQGGATDSVIHSTPQPAPSAQVQVHPSHPVQVLQSTIPGSSQINPNIRPHSSADHFLGDSCQRMCAGPPSDADILDLQPSDESLFDSSLDEKSIDILSEKQLMIKKALNELEGAGSSGESDICKTADDNNNDHDGSFNICQPEVKCLNEMEHSDLEDGEIDEDMESENSEATTLDDHDTRKVQIKDTGSIHINVSFLDQEQFPWRKPSTDGGNISDFTSQSDSEFVQDNTSSPQMQEKKKPFFSPVSFSSPYQNSHLINSNNKKPNIQDIANSWSQMLMTKDNRIERVRGDNSNDQHKGTNKKQVKKMRTEDIKTLGDYAKFETKDENILSLQKYVSVDMSIEISSLSKNRRKTMKKKLLTELENVKAKIAAGTDCQIVEEDSTTSDKVLVMNVTDINDEASHLARGQLEEELRLIRQCISKTWKNNNKVLNLSGESETQLRQDLQALENEIMARINSLQIENIGSVNRRVPKGLLLESEYSEFFSEEGVFLILTCTVSKKIYKKLLKLKEDIRIISVALPRYNSIEDSSKIAQLKQKRRDIQMQRRTLMMTFTGLLTKKRVTKIKTKLKFYNRVHSYLKEQFGEQFSRSFLYLNEVLTDLIKHDILASNLLKNPEFVAEKSAFPKPTTD